MVMSTDFRMGHYWHDDHWEDISLYFKQSNFYVVTVELGKAMFKGFSIRQGEETFIKAVYFALEQACLEGKVKHLH